VRSLGFVSQGRPKEYGSPDVRTVDSDDMDVDE
jgi:hypothetical protein